MRKNIFKRYVDDESGNLAIMFVSITLLIALAVGIGIDNNGAVKQKRHLQDISDSAVLAAAKSLETDQAKLQAIAQDVVDSNNNDGYPIQVNLTLEGDDIIVRLTSSYDTAILNALGKDIIHLGVVSESPIASSESINVALVLDTTGSMSGPDIASLKVAAKGLVDTLERVNNDKIMISVVPFAQYVSLPLHYRGAAWLDVPDDYIEYLPPICSGSGENRSCTPQPPIYWEWKGAVGSRSGADSERAVFGNVAIPGFLERRRDAPVGSSQMLAATGNYSAIRSKINTLNARGWTYIPAGLIWGWRSLTEYSPLTEAAGNKSDGDVNAIVLMTDGANTRSLTAPMHDGSNGGQADALSTALCNKIKAEGIDIYTVAYRLGSSNSSTSRMLEGCATEPEHFLVARNSAQLKDAFNTIAIALYTSRISG